VPRPKRSGGRLVWRHKTGVLVSRDARAAVGHFAEPVQLPWITTVGSMNGTSHVAKLAKRPTKVEYMLEAMQMNDSSSHDQTPNGICTTGLPSSINYRWSML
jgi:hypothetical protein